MNEEQFDEGTNAEAEQAFRDYCRFHAEDASRQATTVRQTGIRQMPRALVIAAAAAPLAAAASIGERVSGVVAKALLYVIGWPSARSPPGSSPGCRSKSASSTGAPGARGGGLRPSRPGSPRVPPPARARSRLPAFISDARRTARAVRAERSRRSSGAVSVIHGTSTVPSPQARLPSPAAALPATFGDRFASRAATQAAQAQLGSPPRSGSAVMEAYATGRCLKKSLRVRRPASHTRGTPRARTTRTSAEAASPDW